VLPGLVAVVLGEKSGFPSAMLVDMGMSVVSVLTGQHNLWGEEKMKSPMKSTFPSASRQGSRRLWGGERAKRRKGKSRRKRKRKRKRKRRGRRRKRKGAGRLAKGG
jgi:hypothetical protein